MNFFPRCDHLRVIVATTLFGRLVDLENIDLILDELTQASIYGHLRYLYFLAMSHSSLSYSSYVGEYL